MRARPGPSLFPSRGGTRWRRYKMAALEQAAGFDECFCLSGGSSSQSPSAEEHLAGRATSQRPRRKGSYSFPNPNLGTEIRVRHGVLLDVA